MRNKSAASVLSGGMCLPRLESTEIYSEGKLEGVARLVDAVVNGLLPPWETEEK